MSCQPVSPQPRVPSPEPRVPSPKPRETSCIPRPDWADCVVSPDPGNRFTRKVRPVILKRSLAAAVFVGMVGAVALAQSTSPLVGTWKLNVAKSKAPFKSGTSVIEAVGEGIKFTVDLVGNDGTKSHWGFTGNFDGKDVPVTGESMYGDTCRSPASTSGRYKSTASSKGSRRRLTPSPCPPMARRERRPPRGRTRTGSPSMRSRSTRSNSVGDSGLSAVSFQPQTLRTPRPTPPAPLRTPPHPPHP